MKKKSIEKIEALYKRIPELDCKGLCHPSCTIVPAEDLEIAKTTGKIPSCGALKDNRCTIYNVRPAICRLYGAAEGLECPFGCEPKKPKLSRQEAYSIIREIRDI